MPAPRQFLLALALLLGTPLLAGAQGRSETTGSVAGTVLSDTDEPVALAVVDLRARRDSTVIRSTQTSESGRFLIQGVAPGEYFLQIRRIGFRPSRTVDFTVLAGTARDLGVIRIETSVLVLEEITVSVERPDVIFEPDRTSFLAEALGGAPDAVVTDALRNVPDITIEFDGTVRVRGATPTIFINGQPAPVTGSSLASFLEHFPANQIERIEVLDAPPARFSAEGSGGIINIVLKQGASLGVSGAVSASAGTRGQRGGGGRLTLQQGPWTLNTSANMRWNSSDRSDFTLRQNLSTTPVTFLRQDATSASSGHGGGMFLDLRRRLSERSHLSLRTNASLNGSNSRGLTGVAHLDAGQVPTLWFDRTSRTTSDGLSGSSSLNFSHAWQPQRHQLEISVSGQVEDSDSEMRDEAEAETAFYGTPGLPWWLTHRTQDDRTTGYSVDGNYTRPFTAQGRLDLGLAHRFTDAREAQATLRYILPAASDPDDEEVRQVSRLDRTTSAWVTANRRLGRFGVNAGLRGERNDRTLTLRSGELMDREEFNLFPSANLTWNPRQRMSLRLGYSRRVGRPNVNQLDPTDRSTDPLNRTIGNPDLRSSLTHNLSLNYTWTGRLGQFSAGPFWRYTGDGFERITTVDAAGISTTTWANLTSRTDLGTSLSWGPPAIKGWRPRLNANASRSVLSGSPRPGANTGGQLRWSVSGTVEGTLLGALNAQGSFGYQPPRDLVQGRTSGQWRADMSFRYRMLDNRTTVNLSVQDPFALRKTSQELRDPSVIQTGTSRIPTRAMSVSAAYTFGRMGRR